MLTEAEQENAKSEKLKSGIRLCEEMIAKSEKYERLQENPDWQGYLGDLKVLIGLHEREIRQGVASLVEAPHNSFVRHNAQGEEIIVNGKLEWSDFVVRHQIQKDELETWLKEPERIVEGARQAREHMPVLKQKLDILTKDSNGDIK